MQTITTQTLQSALICASKQIIDAEPYLTEIDTIIGDGDHGTGMKYGFTALGKTLQESSYATPYDLLHDSGLCLVRNMGGASGVLFGTLLIGGLDFIKEKNELNGTELVTFFSHSVASVQKRGRTNLGDKTMVDALVPAVQAMQQELKISDKIEDILLAGYQGALEGVEKSKQMLPRAGRSKNFRERAVGYPDPGAVSVSIIFKGLCDGLRN